MRLFVPAMLLLLLAINGCARPRYGLDSCLPSNDSSPGAEQTVNSLRYRIRTDAGKVAAHEVGRFMEHSAALWLPLFGIPDPLSLPLEVRLYRDPADLSRLLTSQKLTTHATGLYLPAPTPTIHVACSGNEPGHPFRTLLHEGTHQFIHLGAGYREPDRPPATPRLALPLWLNEGLSSYFEAALSTPDLLQSGRPDPARLAELQGALRRSKVPSLETLLVKRYGEPFSSLDYAVAWGLVYALMQEAPPPWAAGGREWLKDLIDNGRRGWPGASVAVQPSPGDDPWWELVTSTAHTAFERFVNERGMTLAEWESAWRRWLLAHP